MKKPLIISLPILLISMMFGCAPEGAYRDITWVQPQDPSWLKTADFVTQCYKVNVQEDVKPNVFKGVTVVSGGVTKIEFLGNGVTKVTAKDTNGVKYGLTRVLVKTMHPEEAWSTFMPSYGLCFGYCQNWPQPDVPGRCK